MACVCIRCAATAPRQATRRATLLASIVIAGLAMHRSPLEEDVVAKSASGSRVIDASGNSVEIPATNVVRRDPADPPPGSEGVESEAEEETTTTEVASMTEESMEESQKKGAPSTEAYVRSARRNLTTEEAMLLRPNAGTDRPDVVKVRLLHTRFFQADMKNHIFTGSMVLEAHWADPRVGGFLEHGRDYLVLDKKQAENSIWLPDLAITNRDVRGVDTVSYAVHVGNGTVTQVQRVLATMRCDFVAKDFPFDMQRLEVRVASESFMSDAVVLEAMESFGEGEQAKAFDNRELQFVNSSHATFEDVDGPLVKSRYQLTVVVERDGTDAVSSYIEPQVILVALSWLVFSLPLASAFVMPRIAISMLTILSIVSHRSQAMHLLNTMDGATYLGIFMEISLGMCFLTGIINVILEAYKFGLKRGCDDLNRELKYYIVVWNLTLLCMFYVYAGQGKLAELVVVTHGILVAGFIITLIIFAVRYASTSARAEGGDIPELSSPSSVQFLHSPDHVRRAALQTGKF